MKLWMVFPIGLGLMLVNAPAAVAQQKINSNSCQADISRLCSRPPMTPATVKACLLGNKDKLAPDCRKIMNYGA